MTPAQMKKAKANAKAGKVPMLLRLRNDRILEVTHLAIAKAEKSERTIAFHECRIESLTNFIAEVEAMTAKQFKTFIKEHGNEIF